MEARSIIALLCILGLTTKFPMTAAVSNEKLTSLATGRLNSCEKAIWSCCQIDRPQIPNYIPSFCFELNGCYGLHWMGREACSPTIINAVAGQIQVYKREIQATGAMENRIRYKSLF